MRRAGCYGISFGIDVGSRAIGERVRKKADRAKAQAAMRLCDRHGVLSLGYFMIGFLWDTPETLAETADFLHAVRPDLLTIHFAHPYPGTPYYDEVAAQQAAVVSPHAQAEPALDVGEPVAGDAAPARRGAMTGAPLPAPRGDGLDRPQGVRPRMGSPAPAPPRHRNAGRSRSGLVAFRTSRRCPFLERRGNPL